MPPPDFYCSNITEAKNISELNWYAEPNPDISGIGVLVGFVASGYLSVLVLIIRYFTIDGYNDSGTRLPSKLDKSIVSLFSHPLMSVQTFWKYIKRLFTRQSSRLDAINVADSDSESASEGYTDDPKVLERKIARQKWRMILDELILSLSDQQMITGIAILIAGIIQLDSKISFYHWNVLVSLAWFSSLTHLSALTLLRSYFRSRLLLRMFRLFLMTGFAILLIGAMYPLYYNGARKTYEFPNPSGNITEERYLIPPSYPARCLYSSPKMDEGTVGRNLTFGATVVLVFGYTTRVIKLFSSTDSIARKVLRGWPKRLGVKMLRGIYSRMSRPKNTRLEFLSSLLWGPYLILSIVAIVVQVAYCLFESLAWELLWLIFALVWATVNLFRIRDEYQRYYSESFEAEKKWGFGQLISPLLLILPLMSIFNAVEAYRKKMQKTRKKLGVPLDKPGKYQRLESRDYLDSQVANTLAPVDLYPTYHRPASDRSASSIFDSSPGLALIQSTSQTPSITLPPEDTDTTTSTLPLTSKDDPANRKPDHWVYTESPYSYIWFRHLVVIELIWVIMTIIFLLGLRSLASKSMTARDLGQFVAYSILTAQFWAPALIYLVCGILYQNYVHHVKQIGRPWPMLDWIRRGRVMEIWLPLLVYAWFLFWAVEVIGFPFAMVNLDLDWLLLQWYLTPEERDLLVKAQELGYLR